jgi:hypothetical protein
MKKHLIYLAGVTIMAFSSIAQENLYGVSGNMVTGDFDNDNIVDDIAAFNTSGDIPVLQIWESDNGFVTKKNAKCRLPFDFLTPQSLNSKIVSGDFDNDGYIDDIASIYEIGLNKTSITVWINNSGEFTPQRWWYGGDFDANQVEQTIVSGDFDNDGFIDDIAAFYNYDQKQTKIYVWKSNGKQFAWPGTWWIGNDFNSTKIQGTTVSGDFDHDGFIDDIASLYNYNDGYCKIFVWNSTKNNFVWPHTYFSQKNFNADNIKNSVVSGDFNNNGFIDNIAAFYSNDENLSSIIVFEKNNGKFTEPAEWWYGSNENIITKTRLVAGDFNGNNTFDNIMGLAINNENAVLIKWTAQNNSFTVPDNVWKSSVLSVKENASLANNSKLNLYPIPNNGHFTVDIPNSDDKYLTVTIINSLGIKVKNIQTKPGVSLPVVLDDITPGTYIIQITGNYLTLNKSFIIN